MKTILILFLAVLTIGTVSLGSESANTYSCTGDFVEDDYENKYSIKLFDCSRRENVYGIMINSSDLGEINVRSGNTKVSGEFDVEYRTTESEGRSDIKSIVVTVNDFFSNAGDEISGKLEIKSKKPLQSVKLVCIRGLESIPVCN